MARTQENWGREPSHAPAVLAVIFLLCTIASVVAAKRYLMEKPSDADDAVSRVPVTSTDRPSPGSQDEEAAAEQRVNEIVAGMTTEQKVGQLFMVRGNTAIKLNELVSRIQAGGVVLFADDFKGKTAEQVQSMTADLQSASDGNMLVATDEEGGTVVRVSRNSRLRSSGSCRRRRCTRRAASSA